MTATIPASKETEQTVLGAMLVSEPAVRRVIDGVGLTADAFYLDDHRTIYTAMLELHRSGRPVDHLTVKDHLNGDGNYLFELSESVAAPGNVRHHAEIVRDLYRQRQGITLGQEIVKAAQAGPMNGNAQQFADQLQQIAHHPHGHSRTRWAEVEPDKPRFLDSTGDDPGMLPLAAQTILFGPAGLGKTTYALHLAAQVTRGRMPGLDGPAAVLFASAEDDIERVLLPRAIAAGADVNLIESVKGLSFPSGVNLLRQDIKATGARLIVVDPLSAHLDTGIRSHEVTSLRTALEPLSDMAADLDVTVLTVLHPNKQRGGKAGDRISGSTAFRDAARSVIVFGADPTDPDGDGGNRRIVAHDKHNLSRKVESLSVEIRTTEIATKRGPATMTYAEVTGTSDLTADAVLDSPTAEERTERDEARDFLESTLADNPVRSKEIKAAADDFGISERTLNRAKKDLKIESTKQADGWYWSLPKSGQGSQGCHVQGIGTLGGNLEQKTPSKVATEPNSTLPRVGNLGGNLEGVGNLENGLEADVIQLPEVAS